MDTATTEARPIRPRRRPTRTARSGPDRITVILFSLAAVLLVLAVLARQLSLGAPAVTPRRQIVVRRVYRTTVVQTVPGPGSGTSVSQSVASSGSPVSASAAPTTRTS